MNSAPIDQPSKAGKDGKKQTGMKSRPAAQFGKFRFQFTGTLAVRF